jgi:hypothetical protein
LTLVRAPICSVPTLSASPRRVWLNEFGRIVTDAEAVEILSNFKRLAEVLLRIKADQRRQT